MSLFVVSIGHVEVVKLLVSRSADKSCKDKQGYTPLHAAAASGHIEIVKYLLRMGTEVSVLALIVYLSHHKINRQSALAEN